MAQMDGLTCTISASSLIAEKISLMVSNGSNQYTCYVSYDSTWEDTTIIARFSNESYFQNVIISNNSCTIPTNILADVNSFQVGFYGIVDENIIYSTNVVNIDIVTGSCTGGFTPISDNEWTTYLAEITAIGEEIITWASRSPYIGDDGDWYVWDTTTSEFTDTDISASYKLDIITSTETDAVIEEVNYDTVYELGIIDSLTINSIVNSYYTSRIYFTTSSEFENEDFVYPTNTKNIGGVNLVADTSYLITISNNILKLEIIND